MHAPLDSLRKRWYTMRLDSARCAGDWGGRYWDEDEGTHAIRCRRCPKFSATKSQCSVPFGSPIRKCVVAAQEAHLNSLAGKNLLEIGYGKHSIPRRLVTKAGGKWTGIDPSARTKEKAELGKGGFGLVADIPFADGVFDIVVGIQTFEHWTDPLSDANFSSDHETGLREVCRVLKPGGAIYFDAPIHLHGHEMFIAGDIERIRNLFDSTLWQDVIIEKWRQVYEPLERYPTPEKDRLCWVLYVTSYSQELLEDILTNRSVWLMTISATKNSL
jgi:SAM-dependent methyltransferase